MKFVKLLAAAYVNGKMRQPSEGILALEDDEANRLIDGGLGTDVTDDFPAKAVKDVTAESISAVEPGTTTTAVREPHQSEVAPQAAPLSDTQPAPIEDAGQTKE